VESVDSAHRSHTLVVEHTEASVQVFPEAPAFAAVEQNGKDQGDVDLALLFWGLTSRLEKKHCRAAAAFASLAVTSASLVLLFYS